MSGGKGVSPLASPQGRVLPVNRGWNLFQHPRALLPPNSVLALGFTDPQGYDSLFVGRYKAFANLVQGADTAPPENGNMLFLSNLTSPLFPLLAADHVVTRIDQQPQPPGHWPLLYENAGLRIHHCPEALPRAFVAAAWRSVPDERLPEELQRLAAAGGLGKTALVAEGDSAPTGMAEHAGRKLGATEHRDAQTPQHLPVTDLGPNEVRVMVGEEFNEPSDMTMLVLLDNYYPGWRVTDAASGRPLGLRRVNMTFRGVPLPDTSREVRFRYEPASFRFGLYMAALAAMVLAAATVQGVGRRV
jgi:hypothetical protein